MHEGKRKRRRKTQRRTRLTLKRARNYKSIDKMVLLTRDTYALDPETRRHTQPEVPVMHIWLVSYHRKLKLDIPQAVLSLPRGRVAMLFGCGHVPADATPLRRVKPLPLPLGKSNRNLRRGRTYRSSCNVAHDLSAHTTSALHTALGRRRVP
eukprot:3387609-Pyramimonas_sp.AAC.2